MRTLSLLALLAFLVPCSRAQIPGNCSTGSDHAELDVSDVRAGLFNTGGLFFGQSLSAHYFVPKPEWKSPVFAASIWVGGIVDGEVRTAGATYANYEFWPGPLDPFTGRPVDPEDCRRINANGREAWDRVYVVSVLDVEQYDDTGTATDDLADWPVGLGAPAVDANGDPVEPTDLDQLIDLAAGERPVLYGSQTAFWVMNDVGNTHNSTGSAPLGLEVAVTAFSVVSDDDALAQGTFYRYRVTSYNDTPIEDAVFSLYVDADLGDAGDDYAGADTTRGLAFTYNADNDDPVYGVPPAVGYDFLGSAPASHTYSVNGFGYPLSGPGTAPEYYNVMQGKWADGTPMTEGGDGLGDGGPVTTYAFPGDPVTDQFWSETEPLPGAPPTAPGDRRQVVSSPTFTLEPGEEHVFDFAILFGQGADHLDSITELRAASDRVQAAYDDGSLFGPGGTPVVLEAPALVSPQDGETLIETDVELSWAPVAGAEAYGVQVSTSPDFAGATTRSTQGTSLLYPATSFPANEFVTIYWRVRTKASNGIGPFSDARSFTFYRFGPGWAGNGGGLVETAYAGSSATCPDPNEPDDYGCLNGLGGNTVWHEGNVDDDYYLSAGNSDGSLTQLSRFIEAVGTDDYEVRFTQACASFGSCLGVYGFGTFEIISVPFELWNIRDPDDPGDDVRVVPFLTDLSGVIPTDWRDQFTGSDPWPGSPCAGGCPITPFVYFMMPDRPDGYAAFEQAARTFGGPGAVYDPASDGDTQVDLDPLTGEPCANQGAYVDYCYRNQDFVNNGGPSSFIYPIGRLVFADLAGDGTTPEGTTIRFISAEPLMNEPPTANDDAAATPGDAAVLVDVLANDADTDGDPLSIESVTSPASGTTAVEGDAVRYTPQAGFTGTDSFTYTVSDGRGGTGEATVTVVVTDAPYVLAGVWESAQIAVDDDLEVYVGQAPVFIDNDGVSGAYGPITFEAQPGDTLRVVAIDRGGCQTISPFYLMVVATNERVALESTGVNWQMGCISGPTVFYDSTFVVPGMPANRPPVVDNDTAVTDEGVSVLIPVLDNDGDPDGDTLAIESVSDPENGAAAVEDDAVRYTPDAGFSGTDTFAYTVTDGRGGTGEGTVSVTVTASSVVVTAEPEGPVEVGGGADITVTVAGFTPTTAEVRYRMTGETDYDPAPLVLEGGEYTATIPASAVTLRGVEYYVVLSDGEQTVTYPAVNPEGDPVSLQVAVVEAANPAAPPASGVYRMVSVPVALADATPAGVFADDYGDYAPDEWRLLRWRPSQARYAEFPDLGADVTLGRAFWLVTRAEAHFDVEDGLSVDASDPVTLTLRPGWNQVATPYAFPVAWADVGGSDTGGVSPPAAWDGTEYLLGQERLEPWAGYFVENATGEPVTLTFAPVSADGVGGEQPVARAAARTSARPAPAEARRAPGRPASADAAASAAAPAGPAYGLRLRAEAGERLRDTQNLLGFADGAAPGRDRLDLAEPPPPGEHVRLSFLSDGASPVRLGHSFQPDGGAGAAWEAEVAATDGLLRAGDLPVRVALQDEGARPDGYGLWVLDVDRAAALPLGDGAEPAFEVTLTASAPARRLRVIVGTEAFAGEAAGGIPLAPLEWALLPAYPNPARGAVSIPYQVAERGAVSLAVYDLLGRRVAVLVDGEQDGGRYEAGWAVSGAASGVYVYRLRAGDFAATGKVVVVR